MDDEEGTIFQRIARLEAKANTIRGLIKKERLGLLRKPDIESAMKMAALQDLLKSTLARAEWLRRKGQSDR
ncbi:hypothetical protein SAMN02990966_06108 [Rhodospirillales bacterium URHD0017]|nr:hypothetical protein SAMN02990966_06108 [Rhodospirillales bacterium URHD0017]